MRLVLALIVAITLGGCDIPRDPEGTLQRVRGTEMVVGATEADPFVIFENGQPRSRVENEMRRLAWVKDVRVRLREEGHVYFGELVVVPSTRQGWSRTSRRPRIIWHRWTGSSTSW